MCAGIYVIVLEGLTILVELLGFWPILWEVFGFLSPGGVDSGFGVVSSF